MDNKQTRERVRNFLKDTRASKTHFSRTIDISWSYFNNWLRGDIDISERFIDKMNTYLDGIYKK